jgi:hypothetical protein
MSSTGKGLSSDTVFHDRGPDLHAQDCYDALISSPAEWYFFHSRIATTAYKVDGNLNQPFLSEKADLAMCHVGTIHEIDVWSRYGKPVSDGYTLFFLMCELSTSPIVDVYRANVGTVAGWYKGQPYLVAAHGSLLATGPGQFCYSSAFITGGKAVGKDSYWIGNDALLALSEQANTTIQPQTKLHWQYQDDAFWEKTWTRQSAEDLDKDPEWQRVVSSNSNDPVSHVRKNVAVTHNDLPDTDKRPIWIKDDNGVWFNARKEGK